MSTEIVVHTYNDREIREREDGWICLTDMAKANGKLVADWARNERTKSFLVALSANMGIPIMDLTNSQVGGVHAGTWAHPQVAISFAQWCSPAFEVVVTGWVYERIKRGFSFDAQRLRRDPRMMAEIITAMAQIINEKEEIIVEKTQLLAAQQPMVEFYEDTTAAPNWMSVNDAAKVLNREGRRIGEYRLFEFLRNEGVFFYKYRTNGTPYNSVKQPHIDNGRFMECLTHIRTSSDKPKENYLQIRVSGKGLIFIRELLDSKRTLPN